MSESRTILIVDDQRINREILHDLITVLGHEVQVAEDGEKALEMMKQRTPDLLLLDVMMPKMDGMEVLKRMKADEQLSQIPTIVVSAIDDVQNVTTCIELGAEDYLVKPFNRKVLVARVNACLEKKGLQDQERRYRKQIEEYNLRLAQRVREQVQKISMARVEMIFALSKLAESRDPETGEHLERMREYCRLLAQELSRLPKYEDHIDETFIGNIYTTSPLHDIGKVGIPDRILLKPDKLTAEEFDVMKTHTSLGSETLTEVDARYPGNDFVRMGIEIALCHHERWDGTGYPDGLSEEQIPLVARILALGDVYDALTSKRCYKEAYSHEESREIIVAGKGLHFDPDVVNAFLTVEEHFTSIRKHFVDSEKQLQV